MYMLYYSVRFYSWIHAVSEMGAEGEKHFNVGLSYAVSIYIQLEMLYFLWEIFEATKILSKARSTQANNFSVLNPTNGS